jgi:hypothetical protein
MGIATNSLYYNTVFLGVDWRHLPRVAVNSGSERIMRSIIEFIERSSGIVVPVELIDFTASRAGSDVNVSWSTASEKNSSHFVVERAVKNLAGESSFNSVATLPAQGTSTKLVEYTTTDHNVSSASTWLYRLKMVDLDGRTQYSGQVEVTATADNETSIDVTQNREGTELAANVTIRTAGYATVTLVDLTGRTVATLAQGELNEGMYRYTVDSSLLSNGTYAVVVNQHGSMVSKLVQITR